MWYIYSDRNLNVNSDNSTIVNAGAEYKENVANNRVVEPNLSKRLDGTPKAEETVQNNKTTIDNKVYKGEIEFSYGKYTGDISAGKPHGHGSMHYSSSVLINSSDEKQRFSEKGDIFTGKFHKGLPEYGKLYNSLGELKAVMNFGRAK